MTIERENIFDFAQAVWTTVLGAELHEASSGIHQKHVLRGAVQITGAWEGSVTIECSESFAKWAAARMFEADEATMDEVHDALGELTNMVGGNLKALLPGPNRLSIPFVHDTLKRDEDGNVDGKLMLACGGEPIVVTVRARPRADGAHDAKEGSSP